ncbi:MAG: hypothetical protein JWN64_75 [Parcubacteria group bacterium]|nr:hypothetical protein [Parcubacteria group bacterium]
MSFKFDTGYVSRFIAGDGKNFGFIKVEGRHVADLFFHLREGVTFVARSPGLRWTPPSEGQLTPIKGDHLAFVIATNAKGSLARPWGLYANYKDALDQVANLPFYRVTQILERRGSTAIETVLWESQDLVKLNGTFPRHQLFHNDKLAYFKSNDSQTRTRFEKKEAGQEWTVCEDPRTIIYEKRSERAWRRY